MVDSSDEHESIVGWAFQPNNEKLIQSYPSLEFLNSLPFIKKFYPLPVGAREKFTKVTHEIITISRHSEAHSQSAEWLQKTRRSAGLFCNYLARLTRMRILQAKESSLLQYKASAKNENNSSETDHASKPLGIFASKNLAAKTLHKCMKYKPMLLQRATCVAPLPSRLAAKKVAFTLAEVLITLGIIGVVAALTLPTVITKYQKQETIVQLKKAYTTLSNVSKLSQVENGEMQTWDNELLFQKDIKKYVQTYYLPYFQGEKSLTWIDKNYKITNLADGTVLSARSDSYIASVKSLDGQLFLFNKTQQGQGYLWIFADINGAKGPNRIGRDVFVFDGRNYATGDVDKHFIKFWGQSGFWGRGELTGDNITENTPNTGGYGCSKENKYGYYSGFYCGALIMFDGWKISDDYPW